MTAKPHWGWFLLGPMILVLGTVAGIVVFVGGLLSVTEGMQHVQVPGPGSVVVDKPGDFPIFWEQQGGSGTPPLGLEVKITPAELGGAPVPIDTSDRNFSYTSGEWTGRQWGSAQMPAAGTYTVETNVPIGTPEGRLALGGEGEKKLAVSLISFFGAPFISLILCVTIMVVVAVKRSGYRKRVLQQQFGQAPGSF